MLFCPRCLKWMCDMLSGPMDKCNFCLPDRVSDHGECESMYHGSVYNERKESMNYAQLFQSVG